MKKHKDFLFTLLGVAVLAGLIFAVYQSKQPEPVVIDLSQQPAKSPEHQLVSEILKDTEVFAEAEDNHLSEPRPSVAPQLNGAVIPVAGQPLPVAWDSQPAPNIDEVELSPSLQRSLAASASLRTEAYTNPSSELNLQRVADLRQIRQDRQPE